MDIFGEPTMRPLSILKFWHVVTADGDTKNCGEQLVLLPVLLTISYQNGKGVLWWLRVAEIQFMRQQILSVGWTIWLKISAIHLGIWAKTFVTVFLLTPRPLKGITRRGHCLKRTLERRHSHGIPASPEVSLTQDHAKTCRRFPSTEKIIVLFFHF